MQVYCQLTTFANKRQNIFKKYFQMTINTRLRAVLDALGMNTRTFALEAGIDPAVLHNIVSEKGRQSKPSFDILEKILLSFDNISSEYLMRGKGAIFKTDDSEKIKNQMHIKSTSEGVRIEDKKGGQDWGQDWANIKNEMYIKTEPEPVSTGSGARSPAKNYHGKEKSLVSEVRDEERSAYGDLRAILARSAQDQARILALIIDRLDAIERRLPPTPLPDLPGGEKSPV